MIHSTSIDWNKIKLLALLIIVRGKKCFRNKDYRKNNDSAQQQYIEVTNQLVDLFDIDQNKIKP